MKSIILQRSLDVRCWRVIGQVARASKRTEILAVLLRAREIGSTDARDVATHLLFESTSRRVVAERLLRIAEHLTLLKALGEGRYILTDTGRVALETEQVFVPEDGAWTVWASNDPLLATPVLRIDPWSEPSASTEINNKERDKPKRTFEPVPSWLHSAVGVVTTPAAGGGAAIRIDELKSNGETVDPKAELHAIWDASAGRLRLEGELDGSPVDTALNVPDISRELIWKQLLESERLWPQWDEARQALRVRFEDTQSDERQSMRRAVKFQRPEITGFSTFAPTTVENVTLRAASAQDAGNWALWRLQERIRDYATAERFAAWSSEAVEPFDEFQPAMPARRAFIELVRQPAAGKSSPCAWHLMAAEDWGL